MTKFSLKGTEITSLSAWTRDAKRHIWLSETTPDSAKDNPIAETLIQDLIMKNVFQGVLDGLLELSDTTNDAIALDVSSAITNVSTTYTVNRVFYLVVGQRIFKVNTGSDTLVDTIRLEVSATEDGMFQTLDIADGTSVTAYEGNSEGDGVVNVSNILWLGDIFSIDAENAELNIGADLIPITDNAVDLGSATNEFKDLYIDGTAYLDAISAGDITAGNADFSGDVTMGRLDVDGGTNVGFDLNRDDDGIIARFTHSGNTIGQLRVDNTTGYLHVTGHTNKKLMLGASGDNNHFEIDTDGTITISNNLLASGSNTIGETGTRWTNAYFTDITSTNAVTVDSDIRLKRKVETLEPFDLSKLRPVSYCWKGDETNKKHYGFIAQEVREVLPEIVIEHEDRLGIAYTEMIALLVSKVVQLEERINELTKSD